MIGWRRKAKAEREKTVSAERLYDLVNQALLSNFGPLGSYAITRRAASDCDDIFHTMLASSVAHNIVTSLIDQKAVIVTGSAPAAPVSLVPPVALAAPVAQPAPAAATAAPVTPARLAPVELVPVPRELADAVTELAVGGRTGGDYADAAAAELAATEVARAEASLTESESHEPGAAPHEAGAEVAGAAWR